MAGKKEIEVKPERVIALVAGESGTGKSFWIGNLKNTLIFDTDIGGGLSYLTARIEKNGSERIEVSEYPEVMDAINKRKRDGSLKNYTTIAIDHLTTLQHNAVNRHNPNMSDDFGRSYDKATREWRRVRELARIGDFNLICTAHMKTKYVDKQAAGTTTDASKNIEADMSMVLYLQRTARYPSLAHVQKWRRDPEDRRGPIPANFPFTVEEFLKIHGFPLDGQRQEVPMASEAQVKELVRLLEVVKLPDGTADKWLAKAKVDLWDEMTNTDISKCIAYLEGLVAKPSQAA